MVGTKVLAADEIDGEALTELVMEAQRAYPVSAAPVSRIVVASRLKQISEDKREASVVAFRGNCLG